MITAKQVVQAWGVTRTKSRLLQQVVFWHPQRQITRKDGFWSVLSRKEWAEKSSMSLKQYARSVTELTKMGFIEHRRIWFRGEQMAGLRLTKRAELSLADPANPAHWWWLTGTSEWVKPGLQNAQTGTSEPETGTSCSNENNEMNNEKETGEASFALGVPPKPPSSPGKTVKEVLHAHAHTHAPAPVHAHAHAPATPAKLELLWKQGTEGYTKPFTQIERGQLGYMIKSCPAGTARTVLLWALNNWPSFAAQAKIASGLVTAPASPHVGFLVKNLNVAVTLALQAKPKTKVSPLPDHLQLVSQAGPDPVPKATKAEIMQILSDDDSTE
jgi:hypothetical protein